MEASQQAGGSSTPAWGWGRFAHSTSLPFHPGFGSLTLNQYSAKSGHKVSLCGGIIRDVWTSS